MSHINFSNPLPHGDTEISPRFVHGRARGARGARGAWVECGQGWVYRVRIRPPEKDVPVLDLGDGVSQPGQPGCDGPGRDNISPVFTTLETLVCYTHWVHTWSAACTSHRDY